MKQQRAFLFSVLFLFLWSACNEQGYQSQDYSSLLAVLQSKTLSTQQIDSIAVVLTHPQKSSHCKGELINAKLKIGNEYLHYLDFTKAYTLLEDAHQQSLECQLTEQEGKAKFYLARLFRNTFDFEQAYTYLHNVLNMEEALKQYDFYPLVYTELATLEYQNFNYQNAAQICLNALGKFQNISAFEKIEWHNILGLVERAAGNHAEAIYHFRQAIMYAEKNDNAGFGYLYGNIAISMNAAKFPLDTVYAYLNTDLKMSLQQKQYESAYRVVLKIAEIQFNNLTKPELVLPLLSLADSLDAFVPARMVMEHEMDLRLKIISSLPTPLQKEYTMRLVRTNKANLEKLRESNLRQLQSIQSLTHRIASSRNEQLLSQKQKKVNTYLTAFFAAVAVGTSTISVMLYKRRKLTLKLEKSLLNAAMQQQEIDKLKVLSSMLVEAENRVQTAESQHRALTKLITRFLGHQKGETMASTPPPSPSPVSASAAFPNINPNKESSAEEIALKNDLLQHFPTLTEQEIKYCICIWANMNSSEIAATRHISLSGVNKSRNRIRKKLGINANQDLKLWLQNRIPYPESN